MNPTLKMAWRNLWRNPRRSILTMGALSFSSFFLIFMFSWQHGSYDAMIDASVRNISGHLQILNKEYRKNPSIRRVVKTPERFSELLNDDLIDAYTYRAEAFVLLSSNTRTYGALVTGVVPEREAQMSNVLKVLRKGNYLDMKYPNQVVIGSILAQNLKVDIGDDLVLLGQAKDGSSAAAIVSVGGIAESGQAEIDRNLLQMPLSVFDELFCMQGAVHRIVINTRDLDSVELLKAKLKSNVEEDDLLVQSWDELIPGIKQSIELDLISGYFFYGFLLLIVTFSIMNTFLMSVMERTHEFGIMRCVGMTPHRIVFLVLLEAFMLALTSVIIGSLLGIVVSLWTQHVGIKIPDSEDIMASYGLAERIYPKLSWLIVSLAPILLLFITTLSCLYPAWKASKLQPIDALKK